MNRAIADWDRALREDSDHSDFRVWRALAHERVGGPAALRRAIVDLRAAIENEPKAGSHRGHLGRVLAATGKVALALEETKRALVLFAAHPGEAQTARTRHYWLGELEKRGLDLGHAPRMTASDVRALRASLRKHARWARESR